MNIHDLLIHPPSPSAVPVAPATPTSATTSNIKFHVPGLDNKQPIHDEDITTLLKDMLYESGYSYRQSTERNSLTDGFIWPAAAEEPDNNYTPIHIKIIGRHMNGSFRCHIGTGKASRPIQSIELCQQMRLLAVFFRAENSKSQLISPEFIFFPTWLLHLFRYSKHDSSPGRTDIRFLENSMLAKEDHIYRLNNVLNTLFRFNLRTFDHTRFQHTVNLTNYLFDSIGLDELEHLPRPTHPSSYYAQLIYLLQAPRPTKQKPMCNNCNSKPASRRRLCVACYRYQLKHDEPRPLRLIVANQPAYSSMSSNNAHNNNNHSNSNATASSSTSISSNTRPSVVLYANKFCANCGVQETHQWYRNLCGNGHWCETCKSYFLRHSKVRPAELFVKAAKRKVDVRALVNWWPEEVSAMGSPPSLATSMSVSSSSSGSTSPVSSGSVSPLVDSYPAC